VESVVAAPPGVVHDSATLTVQVGSSTQTKQLDPNQNQGLNAGLAPPPAWSTSATRRNRRHGRNHPTVWPPRTGSNEIARGFTTLFRQFDADEAASFNQVQRILRAASENASDEHQAERLEQLTAWGRARSRLRGENLKVRLGQKLRDQGRMTSGIPGEGGMSPVTLISVYQYGDLIHWTDKRSIIEAVASDPFQHAWQRLAFLEAVTGLAHLYIGFSLAVGAAVGRS